MAKALPPAISAAQNNSLGLRQWDLVWVKFKDTDRDHHPAVVVSTDEVLVSRYPLVNVLYGTSKAGDLRPTQVFLNGADGLDHATHLECAVIHSVERARIAKRMGPISSVRVTAIKQKIRAVFRLG